MSLNDRRLTCFLVSGITKEAMPEMELAWLKSEGATSSNRMDAWEEFLIIQGFTYATFSDARAAWLSSLGYTGATEDMLNQYWSDCPTAVAATHWIDGDGWIDSEEWIG